MDPQYHNSHLDEGRRDVGMEEERTWQRGEEKKVRRRGGGVKAERGGKGTCTCTYRCRRWVAHSGTPFNADTMGTITA